MTSPAAGTVSISQTSGTTAGTTYTLSLPTQAQGHTVTQWSVDWGDGTTADMYNDTHTYQSAGDYLIQAFAATSNDGTYVGVLSNNDVAARQDPGFGSALSPLPLGEGQGEGGEGISSMAVQPDGSIVGVESGTGFQPVIARFDATGQPDGTTFDDVSPYLATINSVAVQPVSSGLAILAAGSGFNVARFNSDGSLDTTFGGDGIASPVIPGEGSQVDPLQLPSNLLVQADGKVGSLGSGRR